jgi:hypothetical protein
VCRHQLERANREKTAAEQRAVMRYNTELRAKEAEAVEHARALQSAQRLTEEAERKARQEQQAARGARTQLELEQVQVRRAVAGARVCVCVVCVCVRACVRVWSRARCQQCPGCGRPALSDSGAHDLIMMCVHA